MTNLSAAVRAHQDLVARIRDAFPEADDETIAGSVESETTLDGTIVAVLRAALEREAMAEALGGMIKQMGERKRRLEEGARAMRRACLTAMLDTGWKNLPAPVPDMTVSVNSGSRKLIITDEGQLPDDLVEIEIVRKPKKSEITAALKNNSEIGGAVLSNPEPFLVVSRR
jgi:hypothetical protein